ncbi:ATP-dependent DNA ligase [Amycolatopsis sp. NPDC003731]
MLAKPDGDRLRTGPEWAYEYKLDGYRACMQIAPDGTTVLTSRNGIDFTHEFAGLAGIFAPALDGRPAVIDGEIVVYNKAGQIDFGLLQERRGRYQTHRSSPRRDEPFDDVPVRFLAFDLLQLGTRSLLRQPYEERRGLLAGLEMPAPYGSRSCGSSPSPSWPPIAAPRRTCSITWPPPATKGSCSQS